MKTCQPPVSEGTHESVMDDAVGQNEHRSLADHQATALDPGHSLEFQSDQTPLKRLKEEVERLLLAAPVEIRSEIAAKAESLTQLFAATNHQSPRSLELMDHTLNDLTLLCNRAEPQS
jgi:hypothetical protein